MVESAVKISAVDAGENNQEMWACFESSSIHVDGYIRSAQIKSIHSYTDATKKFIKMEENLQIAQEVRDDQHKHTA